MHNGIAIGLEYNVINFEKQFQEMMNKFKIKPIRFRVNAQVLGHQNVLTITLYTGNQSQVVTELLTN